MSKPRSIFTAREAAELRFARLIEQMEAIAEQAMEEQEQDAARHRDFGRVAAVSWLTIALAVLCVVLSPSFASAAFAFPLAMVAGLVLWGSHCYDRDEHLAHLARMDELTKRRDDLLTKQ